MNLRPAPGPALALALALSPALVASTVQGGSPGASSLLAWLGAGLVSTSLLLMIREPRIAGWFGGLERMYRWHHAFGTLGYASGLAHPLAIALPILQDDAAHAWFAIAPSGAAAGLLIGWIAALGLMVGLGATFALRLPYAVWRRLHATLGISAVLVVVHAAMTNSPLPAIALVALPASAGLLWRMTRADFGAGARPYQVEAVTHPAASMSEIRLRPLAQPVAAVPGQFVMLAFFEGPHFRGCGEYHPFTISRVDGSGSLTVTIKNLGDCTGNAQNMSQGVAARIQGPFGTLMQHRPDAPELWVAGGIGIAAFIARIRADIVPNPTQLVYVYRSASDAAYLDELMTYADSHPRFTVLAQAAGEDAEVLSAMIAQCPIESGTEAFVCGPPGMIESVRQTLLGRGMPESRIRSERFDFR